jgi:branched-subunit amino acid aminotransferase/4-amino-4-deoxychorismate lyase
MNAVGSPAADRIEVDGREARSDLLPFPAVTYGHFTAMQVRGGRVRGLDLHLERLDAGNRELFDAPLEGSRVRELVRHALRDGSDASVRVYAFASDDDGDDVSVMVTVREPKAPPDHAVGLRSVPYQRSVPHTKHISDFGQAYYGRLARRAGFDDALLTGPDGLVSECAIANIALFDGASVVWPDAPALQGITMQLLQRWLPEAGLPSRNAPVRLGELDAYRSAFVTNARGVAPVGRIDELPMAVDTELMETVTRAYVSVPWDQI